MTEDLERISAIEALLDGSDHLDGLIARIYEFGWDYEGRGAELGVKHLDRMLLRFINGEITSDIIVRWANAIEGREDIYFEKDQEEKIDSMVYELANPDLALALDRSRAQTLLRALRDPDAVPDPQS